MACVVSVKLNSVIDGKLNHVDIEKIWDTDKYPKNLHEWLLKLTEEFDLTFRLKSEEANLVPCLLPETEPKVGICDKIYSLYPITILWCYRSIGKFHLACILKRK